MFLYEKENIILLVKFSTKLNFKCKKIKDSIMLKQLTHIGGKPSYEKNK